MSDAKDWADMDRQMQRELDVASSGCEPYTGAMNTYSFLDADLAASCDEPDHQHASVIDARQCWRDDQVFVLTNRLEDARGESSACNDRDCSCHKVPREIEEELGYYQALAEL